MGIFILPDSMAASFIALQLLVSLVLLDRAWRVNLLVSAAPGLWPRTPFGEVRAKGHD